MTPDNASQRRSINAAMRQLPVAGGHRRIGRCLACVMCILILSACEKASDPSLATQPELLRQQMVVVPFDDAEFAPVVASLPDGPRMAVLWGDPDTGPSAVLLEMKRGTVPMHTHSSNYHLVVIEGTMKHWGPGETETETKPLGPGGYWFQPGGQPHADACLSDRCIMQTVWSSRRDATLADQPPLGR